MGFTWLYVGISISARKPKWQKMERVRWTTRLSKYAIFSALRSLTSTRKKQFRQVVELKVDVYVNLPTGYGKSVVFQTLPTVFASVDRCEKNIVIVISPLINLMKDQVSPLSLLGVSAISLRDISSAAEIKKVESGEFSIVYRSPESWLGDIRWRRMLASETYKCYVRAVAVDEAHVICHW